MVADCKHDSLLMTDILTPINRSASYIFVHTHLFHAGGSVLHVIGAVFDGLPVELETAGDEGQDQGREQLTLLLGGRLFACGDIGLLSLQVLLLLLIPLQLQLLHAAPKQIILPLQRLYTFVILRLLAFTRPAKEGSDALMAVAVR